MIMNSLFIQIPQYNTPRNLFQQWIIDTFVHFSVFCKNDWNMDGLLHINSHNISHRKNNQSYAACYVWWSPNCVRRQFKEVQQRITRNIWVGIIAIICFNAMMITLYLFWFFRLWFSAWPKFDCYSFFVFFSSRQQWRWWHWIARIRKYWQYGRSNV